MDNYGSLNFAEIEKKVTFSEVLDWLAIPYEEIGDDLKWHGHTANIIKNKYMNLYEPDHGGVITFVSTFKKCGAREAAYLLKQQFLVKKPEKKKIPELKLYYHPFFHDNGIPEEIVEQYNCGYCKQGMMSGHIVFKLGEHYIGYSPTKDKWKQPSGSTRDTLWNIDNCDSDIIICCTNPFKTLKLLTKGYSYSCSCLGSNLTEAQKEIVNKYDIILYG